jgi:hypothetical protein
MGSGRSGCESGGNRSDGPHAPDPLVRLVAACLTEAVLCGGEPGRGRARSGCTWPRSGTRAPSGELPCRTVGLSPLGDRVDRPPNRYKPARTPGQARGSMPEGGGASWRRAWATATLLRWIETKEETVPDRPLPIPSADGHFTQVWNALTVDQRISATAFRIAVYLGSHTVDWTIREANVCSTLNLGRDAYRSAMRQLVAAGYIERGKTYRDTQTGRLRSDPSRLARRLIVADPRKRPGRTEDGFPAGRVTSNGYPDIGGSDTLRNTDVPNTDTSQEERSTTAPLRADALRGEPRAEVEDVDTAAPRACGCGHLWPLAVNAGYVAWHERETQHVRWLQDVHARGAA